eukprot:2324972-Rhodomonas_salina.1
MNVTCHQSSSHVTRSSCRKHVRTTSGRRCGNSAMLLRVGRFLCCYALATPCPEADNLTIAGIREELATKTHESIQVQSERMMLRFRQYCPSVWPSVRGTALAYTACRMLRSTDLEYGPTAHSSAATART